VVYVAVQSYVIGRSVIPARDGSRYLRFALRLETEPWRDVLRTSVDHPGYPLATYAAFRLGDTVGLSSPRARIVLAQVTSAAFGLVLVVATWLLVRRLAGPSGAFCGTLSFVVLPRPAWLCADVLSDPAFAAFWVLSAAWIVRGIDRRSVVDCLIAGLIGCVAYCARVDALSLPVTFVGAVATGFVLQRWIDRDVDDHVRPWTVWRTGAAVVAYVVAFSTVIVAFLAVYGRISPKPVANVLLNASLLDPARALPYVPLAIKIQEADQTLFRSAVQYLEMLGQQLQFYHLGAAAIAAVAFTWWRRWTTSLLFCVVAVGVYLGVFIALQLEVGYADGRYLLPVLPIVIGFGMSGVQLLGERLAPRVPAAWPRMVARLLRSLPAVALVLSLGLSLPSLLPRPLHDAYRNVLRAGEWCAQNLDEHDTLHDPYFYPTFVHGLEEQAIDTVEPTTWTGRHFIILRARELRRLEPIRTLVDSGRTTRTCEFSDDGGSRRDAWVLEVSPPGSPTGH